jgi:hypothetical protein
MRIELAPTGSSPADGDTLAAARSEDTIVGAVRVDLQFLEALDIPILAGRGFESGDLSTPTTAVIVNRAFVFKVLRGQSPLGRRIRETPMRRDPRRETAPAKPWEEIVGVIPDFPVDSSTPVPRIYRPLLPTDAAPATIAVRVKGMAPASFTNRLRELTVATSPMLRLESIKSLDRAMYDDSAPTRMAVLVLELVTLSAVLLSAAGIYALMSFTITRKRREIGIRTALGAGPRRVLMSVLSRVFAQLAVGILVGIVVAGTLDRLLEGGWTGRREAFVLPAVAALMAAVGLVAAVGPASRALRIPPTEALRSE